MSGFILSAEKFKGKARSLNKEFCLQPPFTPIEVIVPFPTLPWKWTTLPSSPISPAKGSLSLPLCPHSAHVCAYSYVHIYSHYTQTNAPGVSKKFMEMHIIFLNYFNYFCTKISLSLCLCVCSAMLLSIHLGSSRKSLIPVTSLDWRFLLIVPVFRQQVVLQQVRSLYGDGSMRRTPCRAMGACAKQHRGCSMQWVH